MKIHLVKLIRIWMLLLAAAVALPLNGVNASPETLSANQLRPGMIGYAKTVIEGTRIDTFTVEIVGVMQEAKGSEGRIIARVSGDVIDKTGGVLQGMSGSPVYIDGKLIGAISGGWKDIDNRSCIITPIADMLQLWNMPDLKRDNKIKQVDLKGAADAAEEKKDEGIKKQEENAAESDADTAAKGAADKAEQDAKNLEQPLAAPLMVSGFGKAGLEFLSKNLEPFQMVPYAAGGNGGQSAPVTLEPGSSVGAQLVRGDISMAAIGTVTAVEDGKVLAFGHPFLRKGNVNYFMTDAWILTTASGPNSGFKVGVPGNLVGRVNQDRTAAISGVLGQYPSVIPLLVQVYDVQQNKKTRYAMQIAYDEDLTAALVPSAVYNAIDQAVDRLGDGTAKVSFGILTNSAPEGKLIRDNMYYNGQDVGPLAVSELSQILQLLSTNAMRESDILSIQVNVQLDENRKTASVIEASFDQAKVKPGETVNLKLKLKPYRKAEEELIVPYKVPKYQPPGPLTLEVRGGGLVSIAQIALQQQGIDFSAEEDKTKPLDAKIREFLEANKNNEIIVAPAAPLPEDPNHPAAQQKSKKAKQQEKTAAQPESKDKEKTKKLGKPDSPLQKYETEYIIDNVIRTSIEVVEK